jgi:hypothetical protein
VESSSAKDIFNPSVQRTPPLYFALQNTEYRGETEETIVSEERG